MKKIYLLFMGIFMIGAQAQSTYTSTNFASVGDSFYMTSASNLTQITQ